MQGSWATLLGELTALAAVVAISPFTIVPAIALVMNSKAPRRVGPAFLAGWLAGKAAIIAIFVQVPRLLHQFDGSPPESASAWTQIALGGVFVAGSLWGWRTPQKTVRAPPWMGRLKEITPLWAAVAGAACTLVNPKVLLACAAAGYAIGNAQLTRVGISAGVAYFVALASSTVATPILAYAISAERVDPYLERLKGWTRRRSRAIMVGVLMLVGAALMLTGARGL
jgi:hypothetical protein